MRCDHSFDPGTDAGGIATMTERASRERARPSRAAPTLSELRTDPGWAEALAPLERQTLNDQVYRDLRNLIMSGRLKPGQAITIRTLAGAIGVSPMPVRGALHRLLTEGALELRANRSFALPVLSVEDFDEITRVRLSLEGLAAEIATPRLEAVDLRRLREINRDMFDGLGHPPLVDYLGANQQFHFLIYRAARMPRLTRMIESLWLQIGPLLNIATTEPDVASVRRLHETIVKALASGRAAEAAEAIRSDISQAATVIRQWIGDRVVDGRDARSSGRKGAKRQSSARSR
jgi:DNA-binding GntR family transcriptional regulator